LDPLLILLFVVLFFLSAFFSGTELALMSLADHKLESLFKQKKYGSQALKKIKENNDRLLITILIGNNLVNTFTAAFATSLAIGLASSGWFGVSESAAIWIATGMVTFLLLLFGEIIPKSIATKNAAAISLAVAPIYKILMVVLYPAILFMEMLIKLFTKDGRVEEITNEEIESFIDMTKNSWSLEDHEHEKIKNILGFDEIEVEEIMTPRVKIEAISIESSIQEAIDFYLTCTHSRIPVYSDTIDKIDHFITSRDLISALKKWNADKHLIDLNLKKVLKIPLNQSINKVLQTFQNAHKIMAIVLDEYGWVAGLVTMEDIIEEVFGEIRDETDKETEDITQLENGSFVIDATILMEQILAKFGLSLEDISLNEQEFDGETVSYIITHELDRFPRSGEVMDFDVVDSEKYSTISFKTLDILNWQMGHVEVSMK